MLTRELVPGDIVGPTKRGVRYWGAMVVAVYGDLVRVAYGRTLMGPIEWVVPRAEVFRVM
jgi:hypothetical protein